MNATTWVLACTVCATPLGPAMAQPPRTCNCGTTFDRVDGIWRMIPPDQRERFDRFLHDYTSIRHAEGRGSSDPSFFRSLPTVASSHPVAWQWDFHRTTWEHLRTTTLAKLSPSPNGGLRIVDVGAGVGWLSNRVAALGHLPFSIDLSADVEDGLGAAQHLPATWPLAQATFDHLPIADGQADVVIFNASLHYSEDYVVTVREALRVLRPGGILIVMESPVYRAEWAGREMVSERHARFEEQYGKRSDSIPSIEYLTKDRLAEIGLALPSGHRWRAHRVWYGWAWWFRPWKARLKRKRPPARFPLLTMKKPG